MKVLNLLLHLMILHQTICVLKQEQNSFQARNSFKQDKVTYNHDKIVNIYIVYEINKTYNISSYTTLKNCLFGVVSLTKDVDVDNYEYSGYCIGFNRKGEFSVGNRIGRNVIIFEVDMRYLFVNRT